MAQLSCALIRIIIIIIHRIGRMIAPFVRGLYGNAFFAGVGKHHTPWGIAQGMILFDYMIMIFCSV